MRFETKNNKGFTLIELLVVMFIMVTLSTISVANFRQGEKRKRAAIASDTVINVLRTAQNYTLTGRSTNNSDPACRTPDYYFVKFAYSGGLELRAVNNCATEDLVETFNLPPNSRVRSAGLILDGATVATTNLSVYFLAPFGSVRAGVDNGGMTTFTTASIVTEINDGSISRTAVVDGVAGRIGE